MKVLKNHGYCKAEVDGVLRSYVAANEGVFECTPPDLQKEHGRSNRS